ncbi:hypothetical protein E1A91_A06G008500v1 [Gossypium mustelinum]|uniref:Reverse transcriptase domain-containing protein n=1 Tax=Gossypium mustelinum TaxID=34275 RepID=A0A5D2YR63_GOSMU|nr:hypothetical protein E1A91_A06G008500v1 [Gossypium mustelinum]
MECVTTVRAAILVNGSATKEFKFGRGLRQGDPLSPFVFILITEVLHLLMEKTEVLGFIEGIHGLADDMILFLKAEEMTFSGLSINFKKSCIVGFGVNEEFLYHLAALCKCKVGVLPICYLGIPLGADSRRVATWDVVVEKFRKKLAGWKCRMLSSLPIYFMSLFQAPVSVIKRIDKIRRNFLWVNWKQICRPKENGGARVVNLEIKNKALLAKWSKVILAKYGSNAKQWRFGIVENSFDARVNMWMGDKDFKWKVGNGKYTLFWGDHWCGNCPLKFEFPRLFHLAKFKNGSVFYYSLEGGFCNVNWEGFFVRALLDREWGMISRLLDWVGGVVLIPESDPGGWCFPLHGWFKFNVSGIVFEGVQGGGGVLRGEDGIVRALFSGPIDAGDAESTELGAIIIALDIIIEIGWKRTGSFIIEIGSREP